MPHPLKILIVDDEALARSRLRELLDDIAAEQPTEVVDEAANGLAAMDILREKKVDVVLADIRMPGMDGIELAGHLRGLAPPPAIIFTTAYDNYAVQAFELSAIDYLLKPVRAKRLLTALQKARPLAVDEQTTLAGLGHKIRSGGRTHLACNERGRLLLVPVADVLYFKADLKYVTARTMERDYLLDEVLSHLETEFSGTFIRLHRAVLVAKNALAGFEKNDEDDAEAYGWALLRNLNEKLPVSRRLWPAAKALMTA